MARFLLTEEGIKPAAKYTASIRDFPTPKNISDVRSWHGLVNQVAYCFNKTNVMAPFRHLLSSNNVFEWTKELEQAFSVSKEKIIQMIQEGVYSFDPELITCLSTDYSKEGMGWILQQKTCSCQKPSPTCCEVGWRLVLAGGTFCNPAERNYSPIEGEATAILKGLKDTKYYTLGCKKLFIATDHQPLTTTLGPQALADVENKRLAKIKEKTMWWRFEMLYNPGRTQNAADALSRMKPLHMLYVSVTNVDDDDDTKDILGAELETLSAAINTAGNDDGMPMISWNRVHRATQEDGTMTRLIDTIQRGMPDTSYKLDPDLREYHQHRHDLHVMDGVVCFRDRIVIPAALRPQVISGIHAAHQGVSGMTGRVQESVFWPTVSTDILRKRGGFTTCIREAPSQPAGFPTAPPSPKYPFQMIVADYFSIHGHNFLVIADRFTGWNTVIPTPPGKFDGQHLITMMRTFCSTWNIPKHITTDGGPRMTSGIFQNWLKDWDIKHHTSNAYYPHSNSRAETAVKSSKIMLQDCITKSDTTDNAKFMKAVRNTPHQDCKKSLE